MGAPVEYVTKAVKNSQTRFGLVSTSDLASNRLDQSSTEKKRVYLYLI